MPSRSHPSTRARSAAAPAVQRRAATLAAFVLPAVAGACMLWAGRAGAQDAQEMRVRHDGLQAALASSPFQRPIVLQSRASSSRPSGEVFAVMEQPYRTVAEALRRSASWCEILTLPENVKRCTVSGKAPAQVVSLAIGRKFDQPLEDTYRVDFSFRVAAVDDNYLSVQMAAEDGPMGTSAYRLMLEVVPLDASHSFLHLSYAYANGFAAQMATSAYLATAGRDKVGFTAAGRESDGSVRYVDGIRGIVERNTMRYFLAIEAFLGSQQAPAPQRAEKRLRDWFSATQRYPRQLKEMDMPEYLAMKRRELQAQAAAAGETS